MAKKYKIETLQDMVNAVNKDNIVNFITDLSAMLSSACTIKEIQGKVEVQNFIWIDDGKHNAKIKMHDKQGNTAEINVNLK